MAEKFELQKTDKRHGRNEGRGQENFLVRICRPPTPFRLGVKNVKIQENSEKIRGPSGGPLGTLYNPF